MSCSDKKKTHEKETKEILSDEKIIEKPQTETISAQSLGLAYLEENRLEEAEKEFKKMIDLSPEDASGYANLGVVYLRQSKYELAEKNLQKAIELSPDDPDIRLNLAKVYELKNDQEASLEELKKSEEMSPDHVKTLYSIAEKFESGKDAESINQWEEYMGKIVKNSPKNIVARIYLVEALIRNERSEEALQNLEEAQQIYPEFPDQSQVYFTQAMDFLQKNNSKEALTPILIFHNFLKLTPEYQAGIQELKGTQGSTVGVPVISLTNNSSIGLLEGESILDVMKFTDATVGAGLDFHGLSKINEDNKHISSIALADMDGDGDHDMYFSGFDSLKKSGFQFLLQSEYGRYKDITANSGLNHGGFDLRAHFVDYNNDGFLDLFICNSEMNMLYENISQGVFKNMTTQAMLIGSGKTALFADLDHEGDLDLILAKRGRNDVFLNNGNGTFSIQKNNSGISVNSYDTSDLSFFDFDDDGDIDIMVANTDGPLELWSNLRQGNFADITEKSGIREKNIVDIEVADFDNDGDFDLLLIDYLGKVKLLENHGIGVFSISEKSAAIQKHLTGIIVSDAAFLDFDNDGFSDILLTGKSNNVNSSGTVLLHNVGNSFEDATFLMPVDILNGRQIALADYNQDGDIDIFLVEQGGGIRLLRNDGGNANRRLKLQLVGLRTGSGKNNYFGIGASVEVRAGDLYQKKMITVPGLHFGLGQREKADVVRIMWTNGVPQNIFSPGSDEDLIEEQELKGSCPFLYTWNGEEYVFVKDMMWRSALGMPLGIMGGKQAYAFADASEEYLKIPGDMLKEKDGGYTIQITEELWETIYSDQIKLIAVDHPAEAEIYVDEKFVGPPYPELKVLKVKNHRQIAAANDGKGNDLLDLITAKDDRYVSNFQRMKYQGITAMHDLVLDLGDVQNTQKLHLFMNGWIFPTDASINVAISQSDVIKVTSPSLEVINEDGAWQEVIPNIGFPSGKNKTVIVDLSDQFLSKERKVRIRTNMEIYWDHVFFARDEDLEIEMTAMRPTSADHHYRGFSAKYRKGGRYGPHWFDYNEVSTGQKWRDLTGTYTRFGDVTELLQEADDQYIIANAGEETTITFDAALLPKLKDGWKRDFLIYSVGWVKDGDLNTALGQTVKPLPFHGMSQYPYGKNEDYPRDKAHQEYRQIYNTREVGTKEYQDFVKNQRSQ